MPQRQRHRFHDSRFLEFNFEPLERRQMLAGTVRIEISNAGDFRLRGDNADNQFTVEQGSSSLRFTSLDGTTFEFNGNESTQLFIGGAPRDVRIDLRGGDDEIRFEAVDVADDLIIRGGAGSDQITMAGSMVGDDTRIDGGSGRFDDRLVIEDSVIGDDVRLNIGAGQIASVTAADCADVSGSTIHGDLNIRGSRGKSCVILQDSDVNGKTAVNTGRDNDSVVIDGMELASDIRISTSSGEDDVTLEHSDVAGLRVSFGSGDDYLRSDSRMDFLGSVRFDGGSGTDLVAEFDPGQLSPENFSNFEVFA